MSEDQGRAKEYHYQDGGVDSHVGLSVGDVGEPGAYQDPKRGIQMMMSS